MDADDVSSIADTVVVVNAVAVSTEVDSVDKVLSSDENGMHFGRACAGYVQIEWTSSNIVEDGQLNSNIEKYFPLPQ